jgi:hypothetical protein
MLTLTGMLQMPLAKRYYLTIVPGMAWTGDFYLVHKLHYLCASRLLFVVGLSVVSWFFFWKKRLNLTSLGRMRVSVLAGIIISGGFRIYRNMPNVTLDPYFILTIEWIHFGLVLVLGILALIAFLRHQSAYVFLK